MTLVINIVNRDFHGIVAYEPSTLERNLLGFREDGTEGIIWRTKPGVGSHDEDDDPLT